MYLSLQVTGRQAAALGASRSKIFDQRGGSVGRGPQNDWVLPDPERYVSSQHFIIRCMNNAFYLEDVSTNGVFLNGIAEPVRDRGEAVLDSLAVAWGDSALEETLKGAPPGGGSLAEPVRRIERGSPEYSERLTHLHVPPTELWAQGPVRLPVDRMIDTAVAATRPK